MFINGERKKRGNKKITTVWPIESKKMGLRTYTYLYFPDAFIYYIELFTSYVTLIMLTWQLDTP
jgi:hypothetical protein